ncbi:MAG: NAD-dependent epimerase/dehydratase family protein [Gammaproteobacteria bacterium]|nr:NAD-dependent epimerase/dehydratase family protein [Gammaproteobacteria bacterium]
MKILITGAAGSLGQGLVNQLASDHLIEVFATDIKANPFPSKDNLHYQIYDLRESKFTKWVNKIKPEQIIHLASILQISQNMSREKAYEIDVIATKKLLETAVSLDVTKITVTTSGAIYGYYPENKNIITEDRKPRGNEDYFYSAHKAEVESIMAEYRKKHPQLKQLIFRPGAILGPNFEGPVVNLFQQKFITGLIGYPGPFNFTWSEDAVDWMVEGVHSDITGEYNVAGDGILSMKQIAQKLGKFYLPLPALLIQLVLTIAKPLGLTQYGPEQVKFIKYRPVLSNKKIKECFKHQPRYTSEQVIDAFLESEKSKGI